jgi:hypothetical protein
MPKEFKGTINLDVRDSVSDRRLPARVVFYVADDAYIDVERHLATAIARD